MTSKKRGIFRAEVWSAHLGNLFEHYDTALFGFLSPFLSPLLFPEEEPLIALLFTYAIIPLGMLVRPLGALVFGYIGDVHGRTKALSLSLFSMAIVSGLIAITPLYAQVGLLAPVLFVLSRLMQNFLASGEMMGGAVFVLEKTEAKKHDFLSSLFGVSTIGGILLASAGVACLSHYDLIASSWRYLYVFGCVTAFFGFMIRRTLRRGSSPVSASSFSWKKVFQRHWKALLCIMVSSGFSYATYSISLVLMNGFIPLITSWTKAEMMSLNTGLLIVDFFALPFFGWLSSKLSRKTIMLFASIGAAMTAIPFCFLLENATFIILIGIRVLFVLFGVAFSAPFHAWTQQLVPATERYAVISLGYALGSQLFGGPTAAISLWLYKQTGNIGSIAWWWTGLALSSAVVVALSQKVSQKALAQKSSF